MVTQALAPRPTVCASATRAPATWRGPRAAAQLPGELDDLAERRRAERLALGEEAAARVHRQARSHRAAAVADPAAAAATRAEAELLRRQDLARGVGVLHLGEVDVGGAQAGGLVRARAPPSRSASGRRRRRGRRAACARRARSRRGAIAATAAAMRTAGAARRGRHDDRRRALVRRAQHEEPQRLADDGRGEHLVERQRLAVHRVRVVDAVAMVLHRHRGEVGAAGRRSPASGAARAARSTPASPRGPLPRATARRSSSGSCRAASSRPRRRAPCRAGRSRPGRRRATSAAPPLAQPASTLTIGTPESPSAVSTLWPVATPP